MPRIDNAATALDRPGADPAVSELRRVLTESAGSRHDRLRSAIAAADDNLYERFGAGAPVGELVRARAAVVDALLKSQWDEQPPAARDGVALVAVGGFGRGELHPKSDVDIMVLLPDEAPQLDWLSDFLTALWDSGLEIGHSVRTVADCEREARDDITVTTTLMEARLLTGPESLFAAMQRSIGPGRLWDSKAFFKAKVAEQGARHARYDDTAYKLEPNVKGSPGGLRDIQMIGWVANRHFGSRALKDLVQHEFLTEGQLRLLIDGRDYLWRIRFALHMLTGRAEDRLLFDHQKQLAQMLGYEDARYTLAVEQMMQRYYRTVMDLSRLNEILLQLFEEAILLDSNAEPVVVNERFKLRNGFLQTRGDEVFRRYPSALLEVFLLLQQNPEIRGVSAWTVGLIKRSLGLIDDEFRQSPRNHRLFLKILEAPEGVTHELRRMNRYGVLGLYIPAFGRIVGRMQFDLFHAYTVDEHTLFVVSNLRRFALTRFDGELPHCSAVMRRIDKPVLAYLSGLFHDIAKGRGGDHSRLGATDARSFCLEHGLDEADADLVAWLVRHHLLLSMTAQKKDLSDPAVIRKFAAVVGAQRRLDYLYVLTVADVRGTNPRLWNSWKASLFQELYERTRDALTRGVENTPESEELIAEGRAGARSILERDPALDAAAIERVWSVLPDDYFQRYGAPQIAWHTRCLANAPLGRPTLDVRTQAEGLELFLYTPHEFHTFANTTAILDELGLNILDARIVPAANGFSLDTYVVHEYAGQPDNLDQLAADVRRRIERMLSRTLDDTDSWRPRVTRRASRRARVFRTADKIQFSRDAGGERTIMELTTADRPGLLLAVGDVFVAEQVDIAMAKIVTIGERAEDVFYLTDTDDRPLSDAACERLREALLGRLARDTAQ